MRNLNKDKLFSYCIFLSAIVIISFFLILFKINFINVFFLIFFYGILTALCELFPIKLPRSGTVSISSVIIISSWLYFAPKYGPIPVLIVTSFACVWPDIKKDFHVILFNWGQYMIAVGIASWFYDLLYPYQIIIKFPVPVLAFLVSIVCYHILNSGLVSISLGIDQKVSPIRIWLTNVKWQLPNYFSIAIFALVFHELFRQPKIGFISVTLLLVPLIVARQTYQYYVKLKSAYAETVSSLIKAVEAKDHYTRGHSERVAEISAKIGREYNLNDEEIENLQRIATLHDIGKIGIPKRILTKPSGLTDEEYDLIKEHPKIGAQILKNVEFLQDLIPAVYYHHERVDGSGYSSGLSGEKIPLFARIIAIADAYDAMTSDRAYRKALTNEQVIEEFKKGAGTQFDAVLVEHLFDALGLKVEKEEVEKEPSGKLELQPENI